MAYMLFSGQQSMVVHTCDHRAQKAEAGWSQAEGQWCLDSGFEASLDYMRPYFKEPKQIKIAPQDVWALWRLRKCVTSDNFCETVMTEEKSSRHLFQNPADKAGPWEPFISLGKSWCWIYFAILAVSVQLCTLVQEAALTPVHVHAYLIVTLLSSAAMIIKIMKKMSFLKAKIWVVTSAELSAERFTGLPFPSAWQAGEISPFQVKETKAQRSAGGQRPGAFGGA